MNAEENGQVLASITFLDGPLIHETIHITKPTTSIGRHSSNDIVIRDQRISRFQAQLVKNGEVWSIEKLSQSLDILVDHRSIEKAEIRHNSTIALGTICTFVFHSPVQRAEFETIIQLPQLSVQAQEIPPSIETVLMPEQGQNPQPVVSGNLPVVVQSAQARPPSGQEISIARLDATQFATFTTLGLPSLEITDNASGTKKTYPLFQENITIGQDMDNNIVVNAPVVSDFHLQIVHQNAQWMLVHPPAERSHTRNGLLYQGRKIRGNKAFRKVLAKGDVFRIEDEIGNMVTLTFNDGSGAPQVIPPHIQPVPLHNATVTIGRAPDNDVVLNHPQVSAHHLRLTSEGGSYRLTDLNSSNHTYVNGILVSSIVLKPDDDIRVGPFRFIYTDNELRQYDESESIGIDAVGLKKVGNNQVVLLNNISLSIPPRSFVALVGGSGAGKSTLLDALSGLRLAHEGMVLFNGQDYYKSLGAFRTQIGYVPQEDIIHRDLTVERALYYAAKLRLPKDFTLSQIQQRIDEVLEDVEMTHRRKLLIKKLSGGQRKRVSIALELLANPSIFFLDEPTSGLDPGLDRKMMLLLRKLADKGHTVLLVTHATNNINVCDAVCFLAPGGRLAYYGPPEEAKLYFQQPDFAEIYNALEPTDEHPTIPQDAQERFERSGAYKNYISEPLQQHTTIEQDALRKQHRPRRMKRQRVNPVVQFFILCQRYLELLWNDKWNLLILLLQAPIIGCILFILVRTLGEGTIFKPPISLLSQGDAQRYLFVMSFAAVMFGSINASREIVKEVHIYRRERTVNLGILPYLISKVVVLSLLCFLQCAMLLAIVSLALHFYDGIFTFSLWEVYITLVLSSIAGVLVGLTISALVRNNDQAMSFIPLVLIPQVIFSGSMFPLKGYPMQIFGALFSLRWSMAALGSIVNLLGNGDKVFGTCNACNTYQHTQHYVLFTWLALVATILLLSMLTGYFLKRKDYDG